MGPPDASPEVPFAEFYLGSARPRPTTNVRANYLDTTETKAFVATYEHGGL